MKITTRNEHKQRMERVFNYALRRCKEDTISPGTKDNIFQQDDTTFIKQHARPSTDARTRYESEHVEYGR